MTEISKTIVFFGTENFSLISLEALIKAGYNITAVVTKPDSKRGRGQSLTMPSVKKLAIEHNIDVWQPQKISDINENIKSLGGNTIGVLVSFGKIIPKSTIDLFNPGIINVHPSLLPKYRGPSPIESAINNGDIQTGVSIMKLSAKMDAGPIYNQIAYALNGKENQINLYNSLAKAGAETLINLLPNIIEGSLLPTPQDESQATYCNLLKKEDAWLKPNQITSIEAERKIRANLEFPKTKINIFDYTILITKAHVSEQYETILDFKCKDEKFLTVDELIAPSGRTMTAKDFLNGHKQS